MPIYRSESSSVAWKLGNSWWERREKGTKGAQALAIGIKHLIKHGPSEPGTKYPLHSDSDCVLRNTVNHGMDIRAAQKNISPFCELAGCAMEQKDDDKQNSAP